MVHFVEASQAICVRAVKSYSNSKDPQSLSFATGDLITVSDITQHARCKGLLPQFYWVAVAVASRKVEIHGAHQPANVK